MASSEIVAVVGLVRCFNNALYTRTYARVLKRAVGSSGYKGRPMDIYRRRVVVRTLLLIICIVNYLLYYSGTIVVESSRGRKMLMVFVFVSDQSAQSHLFSILISSLLLLLHCRRERAFDRKYYKNRRS